MVAAVAPRPVPPRTCAPSALAEGSEQPAEQPGTTGVVGRSRRPPACQSRNVVGEGQGASVPRCGGVVAVPSVDGGRRVPPDNHATPSLSPPPPPPSRRARGGKRGLGKLGGAVTHSPGALRFRGWCCLGIQHTKQSHASRASRPVHCLRGQTAAAPHRSATQKPQRRRREDRAVVMKLESGGSTGALPHGWPLCTTQSACPVSEGPRQPPMDFK